jgi:2-polyprenyl-3-methyl-5-hydroxy-6-metoxy-1,4-benzoquinol methylase
LSGGRNKVWAGLKGLLFVYNCFSGLFVRATMLGMQPLSGNLQAGKSSGGFLDPSTIVGEFGVTPGMSIADFGCGSGYFTILVAQKTGTSGKVYALDIMESALDAVRLKAKAARLDNIETVHTNLEVIGSSSLSDRSQDMVLLANVLFQSNKKEEIFKEANRILKSNAKMIVIDWNKGGAGFGPPDHLRTDDIAIQNLGVSTGFTFEKSLDAGKFHYGLIFHKN